MRGNRHKYCINPETDRIVIVYKGDSCEIFFMNIFDKVYGFTEYNNVMFLTDEELEGCIVEFEKEVNNMSDKLKKLLTSEYIWDGYEGIPLKTNDFNYWGNEIEPSLGIEKSELAHSVLWYNPCTKEDYNNYMNEYYDELNEAVELTRKQWNIIMEYLESKPDSDKIKTLLSYEMRWR